MKTTVVAILGGAALLAPGYGDITETVAHWSYDAPTLTIAAGSITGVLDSTGDHNATPGSGIGSATVANGGPTFTSNPIPTSNSIPGRFGEALTLTGFNNFAGGGGQFLMFPDIKEIMAANGAPNYTVSMWVNTTNTSFNVFAGLSEWGNAATTPGRFAYGFGPSGPTQMRGQTRFDLGTNGTDIYARSVTTAPLNDANWHMLTWSFETNTGTLRSYFDGALVDTFTSAAANFQMVTSSSTFGSLGFKGDTGNFINGSITFDEMYVFLGAATDSEVQNLFAFNVIPEPGSLALTGLGAILLGACRHRRMSEVGSLA